ncbi:MAG: hypothetical protein ACTSPT_10190 [Candidatus Heimdallarchaeota archaeon]
MIKKRILVFVTLTVLLLQVALVQTNQSNAIYKDYFSKNTRSDIDPSINYFTPDAPPGTEVVKANIFKDGACEEEQSDGEVQNNLGAKLTQVDTLNIYLREHILIKIFPWISGSMPKQILILPKVLVSIFT